MTDLLKAITSILPSSQKAAINTLIAVRKKSPELQSLRAQQAEVNKIYNDLKSKLGKVLLIPRLAISGSKISSDDHNKNMQEIFLDLNTLYENIDQISKLSLIQSVSLDSEYQKSKATIERLLTDTKLFSLRKKYSDFNEIKYIDFNSTKNNTSILPKAEVNPKTRLLQAKQIDTTRAHLINREAKVTKIYTKTKAVGIKSGLAKSFPPELMSDQKPETFWTTLVMCDSAVSQIYEKQTRNGISSQEVINGPVTEIFFKFSNVERLNHIRLLPFSDYPLRILDIAYRPSINSTVFFTIDGFKESVTLDWEEFNFNSIFAHEVRITIAQENPKQAVYQLPRSVITNTDVFQKIYDAKLSKFLGNELVDSDIALDLIRQTTNYENAVSTLESLYQTSTFGGASSSPLDTFYDFNTIVLNLLQTIDPDITKETILATNAKEAGVIEDELVSVRKFEYILGMREVEMGYALYSPVSYYESEKFDVQATVSEIQLEVEEDHTLVNSKWGDPYKKTSVEWSVDLGGGRIVPIHPRNLTGDIESVPTVKDELIQFNSLSGSAYTRMGGRYASINSLKKEGEVIPETEYRVSRIPGAVPKLKIDLTGSNWYDPVAVYSVDYAVDVDSYKIDVLTKYNSEQIATPDKFNEAGPDNNILLSKYPFINYEVINLTGYFSKTPDNAWVFVPPQKNITSGQLTFVPQIIDDVGNILQTGSISGFLLTGVWGTRSGETFATLLGNPNLSLQYFNQVNGVKFGYYLQVMDSKSLYEISGFNNTSGFSMYDVPEFTLSQIQTWDSISPGVVFSGDLGSAPSGSLIADYAIGIGVKTDDQIFALSENTYYPISVTVGGKLAKNITDYEKFEHPAFSSSSTNGANYEYIQAGKSVYFNLPAGTKEVKVDYRWISDYVKVIGTLRSHQKINPDLSAKVNSILLLINNMVI